MATRTDAQPHGVLSEESPARRRHALAGTAFWLGAGIIFAIAVAMRLLFITNPPGFDEGKYIQGLINTSRGYRPFAEIFNPQGPLFYPVLFPFFKAFGETLEAARYGSITLSLVGMLAVGWMALRMAGPAAALLALSLMTVSPQYLAQSRVIQSEAAALGFALPAAAVALAAYQVKPASRWHPLLLFSISAGLLALSLSVKALTLGTTVLLFLCVVLARDLSARARLISLVLMGATGLGVLVLASLPFGVLRVWEQGVVYHAALKAMQGPELLSNWARVQREMSEEGWGLLVLAGLGLMIWLKVNPQLGFMLLAWLGVTFAVLMTHSPLLNHHMVTLVPPLALLSVGLCRIRAVTPRLAAPAIAASLACYALAFPKPLEHLKVILHEHPPHQLLIDAGAQVRAVLGPQDVLVTDHPYGAYLAQRATPPELADADKYRLESGWLSSQDLVSISTARDAKAALLWLGIYERHAPEYVQWLQTQYFPLWSSEQPGQVLYVRKDIGAIDVAKLPGFQATPRASFGADIELLGYAYPGQGVPGSHIDIRMIWRATTQPRGDYRVYAAASDDSSDRNPNAAQLLRSEDSVVVGSPGPSTIRWSSGDIGGARVRVPIPADARIGRTHLYIGLIAPDGAAAASQALESDGKPRRTWQGMMFLSDLHVIPRS